MYVMRAFFFFNDTATTEIYTLSLHDALPISDPAGLAGEAGEGHPRVGWCGQAVAAHGQVVVGPEEGVEPGLLGRSEEHTSELQSRQYLVCRLLLEKKNTSSSQPFLPLPLSST